MELPTNLYPEKAQVIPLTPRNPDIDLVAIEDASGGALWGTGRLVYIVSKFGTTSKSAERYEIEMSMDVIDNLPENGAISHEVFSFQSAVADQADITCGWRTLDLRCIYRAQYEEFFIYIDASIDEQFSDQDFLRTLAYFDNLMAAMLK